MTVRYDTIVGISARNEEATVAEVATVADAGLQHLIGDRSSATAAIVLAENASTDQTVSAFLDAPLTSNRHVLRAPTGSGKGTNVQALITFALRHRAERLILLDADLRSARPEWVTDLAAAVDTDEPTMAVPVYARDRFEAGTTTHLVVPLLTGLFDTSPQQPIGGEFAFNRAFLKHSQRWTVPGSAWRYGVDVWLTAHALQDQLRLVEVFLGEKRHTTPFANVLFLPQQVLDSLLHVAVERARNPPLTQRPPQLLPPHSVSATTVRPQHDHAVRSVLATSTAYISRHYRDIQRTLPSAAPLVESTNGPHYWIDGTSWPLILADAIQAVGTGDLVAARDHLIALYTHRLVTFWHEIADRSPADIQTVITQQTADADTAIRAVRASLEGVDIATSTFDRGHWSGIGGVPPR